MKITTIQYKKVFPIGAYQNEPLGIEATLDENEDPIEAFKTLKQLAQEAHLALNPSLYDDPFSINTSQQEPKPALSTEEIAIKEIGECTYYDVSEIVKKNNNLAGYELLSRSNDKIKQHFDSQLLKITHNL